MDQFIFKGWQRLTGEKMTAINGKKTKWNKLDNASKIFPATANNKDTKVYRLSAELFEEINPDLLQKALDLTLESFPLYKSILRRGFFWYYFESSEIYPKVDIESTSPCSPLYIEGNRNLLFKVSYYNKRINLEAFHALSDGAGAIWFLETLIFHYLEARYMDELDSMPHFDYGASISEKEADGFWKNYAAGIENAKTKREKKVMAYKIKGKRLDENRMKIIEGAMSAEALLTLSRRHSASMTVLLTSLLIYAAGADMPKNSVNKKIVISVPINLRGYYDSLTARNFFSTMNISCDFGQSNVGFSDIVEQVNSQFKEGLKEKNVKAKLARFMKLEKNLLARMVPLTVKDYALKMANKYFDKGITSSLSNIGKIDMPPEFKDYVKQFSVCASAKYPKVTFCSYGDRLVISFTSPYVETDIQRVFFQFLSGQGIEIEVTSNL